MKTPPPPGLLHCWILLCLSGTAASGEIGRAEHSANKSSPPPEVWLCPPGNRVLELMNEDADVERSLRGVTGLKLYIDLMKTARHADLAALAALIRTNNLKIVVELGGTLNHGGDESAETIPDQPCRRDR